MAKKSRRTRREEGLREVAAPRVPNSLSSATTSAPRPVSTPTIPAAPRAPRPSRTTTDTGARLNQAELSRDMAGVRQDLRKIVILATALFVILIVLAFVLPQVLR